MYSVNVCVGRKHLSIVVPMDTPKNSKCFTWIYVNVIKDAGTSEKAFNETVVMFCNKNKCIRVKWMKEMHCHQLSPRVLQQWLFLIQNMIKMFNYQLIWLNSELKLFNEVHKLKALFPIVSVRSPIVTISNPEHL